MHHTIVWVCLIQYDINLFISTKRCLAITIITILRSPYQHVTLASCQKCMPISVCIFGHHRTKFCIVINHEIHPCICHRFSLCIHYIKINTCCRCIVIYQVDFSKRICHKHFLFWTIIFAKHTGMHQQGTARSTVKPTQVQYWFWFTGTHEPPLSISPRFDPSMIVVCMGPSRGIYLTGRDTYSPEG